MTLDEAYRHPLWNDFLRWWNEKPRWEDWSLDHFLAFVAGAEAAAARVVAAEADFVRELLGVRK